MGTYINPPDGEKEKWLDEHGIEIAENSLPEYEELDPKVVAVCLVDNGAFAAAGVADCRQAFLRMREPDFRPKKWFLVRKTDIREVCPNIYLEDL